MQKSAKFGLTVRAYSAPVGGPHLAPRSTQHCTPVKHPHAGAPVALLLAAGEGLGAISRAHGARDSVKWISGDWCFHTGLIRGDPCLGFRSAEGGAEHAPWARRRRCTRAHSARHGRTKPALVVTTRWRTRRRSSYALTSQVCSPTHAVPFRRLPSRPCLQTTEPSEPACCCVDRMGGCSLICSTRLGLGTATSKSRAAIPRRLKTTSAPGCTWRFA